MVNSPPLISVIIPTHNYGAFIRETIESVFLQDYPTDRVELIIVDDGSTDNTKEIVQEYAGRVTYLYEEHRGVAAARNKGMSLANGEIITFLDADDVWVSGRTRRVAETFNKYPDMGIVYHTFDVIDSGGRTVYKNFYGTFLAKKNHSGPLLTRIIKGHVFCGGSSFSFRRALLKELYPIPEDMRRGVDFYLTAVASCYAQAVYLPEILGKYRLHHKNITFFVDANPLQLAGIHKDFSYTYEKLLVRLSPVLSMRRADLKALKRRHCRSSLLFSVLSGNRLGGIKQLLAMFKSTGSFDAFLSNIGLLLFVLFVPEVLYTWLIKCYYSVKKKSGSNGDGVLQGP